MVFSCMVEAIGMKILQDRRCVGRGVRWSVTSRGFVGLGVRVNLKARNFADLGERGLVKPDVLNPTQRKHVLFGMTKPMY